MTGLPAVHLVEAGGRGGVHQHTATVAVALAERGVDVVLHTADDREPVGLAGVRVCGCVRWHRGLRQPGVRRVAVAADYLLRTLPHLRRATGGSVVHVQGLFKVPLQWCTLSALSAGARPLVFSPHNTFVRGSGRRAQAMTAACCRVARVVVTFSGYDRARASRWNSRVDVWPLSHRATPPDPAVVGAWRRRLSPHGLPLVLFAGQVRADKRLDLLLRAAATSSVDLAVAVVGEDKGEAPANRRLADTLGVPVTWVLEYVDEPDFHAALAAADVVVCPYDIASQSGVLSLARRLGTVTVASDVGGLAELADLVVPAGVVEPLCRALEQALGSEGVPCRTDGDIADVAHVALATYARCGRTGPTPRTTP